MSLALESTFPISIVWGPGHVQIYNDGYWPICGAKHPTSMGQDFRECWASAFPIIGAAYERAWSGEADYLENQRMFLDRNGFLEEAFFTFSFSPIRDEAGDVAGLFHPVIETTVQMLSERRIRCLGDLASHAGRAKTVDEAYALAAKTLAGFDLDLPFVRLYRLANDGQRLHLEAVTGLPAGEAPPATSEPIVSEPGRGWPFAAALDSERGIQVDEIERCVGAVACGPYPESPRTAWVLPIRIAGVDQPQGILVAGISARLPFDAAYRDFFYLVANAIAAAIGNARAYADERKRAEALAEIDRAKTMFFSNISHELRTPLTLVLGPLQNARTLPEPALKGADLDAAHRNAQRLLKLVNQLLDFARFEARRAQPSYQPTDVAALTADLASAFRSAVEHAGLALNVECPPLARPVDVDPDMWEKIVLNLVSNAFKFTFAGSIDVAVRDHGDRVELSVRDTGVGIPADHLTRVFERFHRIEGAPARTYEGTGIGLALVRDLVVLHDGRIDVASELDRGTTFTVTIPRVQSGSTRGAVVAATAQKDAFVAEALRWLPTPDPAEPLPIRTMPTAGRILLVDDNADMREYLQRLLGARWDVEVAADGEQALAVARAGSMDLVVADVMMPRLDGFGLVAALRADVRTASLPIILLSARAGDEAIAEGLRGGADDYIVKPFTASSLLARVETLLAASRARQVAQEMATAARRRFYSLLMDAPAAMCSLRGPELIVELANARVLELWGRDPTVIGKPLLEALPEIAEQAFPGLLREVMRTGVPYVANQSLARLDSKGDGVLRDIYLDFVYAPTREDDGTVSGVLVFAVDVTEKVLIHRELASALAVAHDANRAKDDFLALLGHELRNPLAPITTALELIELRGFAGIQKEAGVIERQTQHLARLVDDLMDVSRITSGKIELHRRATDLAEIVVASVELASPLFEQKQHHLTLDVAAGIVVDVDPMRMTQVLSNLLTNAAKYTDRGGVIALAAKVDGEQVVITVRDNGTGMAPETLPHVFDMFIQERRSVDKARGGLGLGLTIVRGLVVQHGGSVSAHSEGRGTGSRFEVRLPRTHEASPPPHAPSPRVATGAPRRVLIVDDNVDAAEMLADAMGALGHDTRIAFDGPSALKVAQEFIPDLGLIDLGLPVMDGYELAHRLRALPPLRALRMIAVTGYGQPSDRIRSRESGFDAHLVKPVDMRGLASLMDELLTR
ncbi:MAG: ATP-binding protein [Myxococcota bacterium]|nr:ATP-binding protein [Myxococcota bacterium]